MIVEHKAPLSEAAEAPPAYEELGPRPRGFPTNEKEQRELPPTPSSPPLAGPSSPRPPPTPKAGAPAGSSSKTWFGLGSWFSEKDTRREVKQTIQSLMRDVVKEPCSPASVSVIQSCLEACQARGLSFEAIISEKFIEGHSPLYWAIVKLPPLSSDPQDDRVRLLDILLSFPLNATTRSEAYLACLLSSDQALFQRLRHAPGMQSPSVSSAAELLLGNAPQDELLVENEDGDHGEFRVRWKIAQFQKRMRVVGGVGTEIVARGRIWSLALTVLPRDTASSGGYMKAGSWVASVSLLAPSPPTHLDAQFTISEPAVPARSNTPANPPSPSHAPADPPRLPSLPRKDSRLRWPNASKSTQKPDISLRVKTEMAQLEALSPRSTTLDLRDHVLTQPGFKTLIVPLNSHPNGDSLQFDGCTYLDLDDSLSVTFDARLAKSSGGDCIIC